METITLKSTGNHIVWQEGVDEQGNHWLEFEVDELAEQHPGECTICGKELWTGVMNLDCGGEEICHDHVNWVD